MKYKKFLNCKIIWLLAISILSTALPIEAAELLANPREHSFNMELHYSPNLSTTEVICDDINVRWSVPLESGRGGFIFARLDEGDSVYVMRCERYALGHLWVYVYIPELQEFGYVAAEFLQNNFNIICDRTLSY